MALTHYDIIVLGKGMMGSAAAKYLAQAGARVALIGPDEPADLKSHDGVFASHYDQGRITRCLAADSVWAELARRSIAAYPTIEQASGISFHRAAGGLYAAPPKDVGWPQIAKAAAEQPLAFQRLAADEVTSRFPYLQFPAASQVIFEEPPAGYINPRDLVQAQVTIARQQGTAVIPDIAIHITPTAQGISVTTRSGSVYQASKVLVANGAYANSFDLLPRKLALRVKTEFVILGELSEMEATRLAGMPTVIDKGTYPQLTYLYLLPPIRYPDGKIYVKLGANTAADYWLPDEKAMQEWMRHGNSDVMLPALRGALQSLLTDLQVASWQTRRCLVTYTPHGRPIIAAAIPDRLYVCTGGNGHAAKSSDAIGHLAAKLVLTGQMDDELHAGLFAAVFA